MDNILYIAGGYDHSKQPIQNFQSFSLETNSFSELASMNIPRASPAISSLNNQIIVAGGDNGDCFLQSVEAYDIYTNKWKMICPLNKARYGGMMIQMSIFLIIYR